MPEDIASIHANDPVGVMIVPKGPPLRPVSKWDDVLQDTVSRVTALESKVTSLGNGEAELSGVVSSISRDVADLKAKPDYVLPPATRSSLGGVRPMTCFTLDPTGELGTRGDLIPFDNNDPTPIADRISALQPKIPKYLTSVSKTGKSVTIVRQDGTSETFTDTGDENVIETVKVNGTPIAVSGKAVDVNVPTKASQLENDKGYLTEHQDISGKQDKLIAGEGIEIGPDGKTIRSTARGGVTSVNDKTGAVELTAADVGALPISGGSLEGNLSIGNPEFISFNAESGSAYIENLSTGSAKVAGDLRVSNDLNVVNSVTVDGKDVMTEIDSKASKESVEAIAESISTDSRFLVGATSAAVQTRESEEAEWTDEIRVDKGYDALTGETAVKLDKSVQSIVVSGETTILDIVLPDAVDGTVRDLCLYVSNTTETDCALNIPDGTYYGDDPNGAVAKAGQVTAVYFTEIPVGAWLLRIVALDQHTKPQEATA